MSIFTDIVSIFAITFSLIFLVVIFFLLLCYFLNRRKQNEDDNGTEIGDVLCNLRTRTFSMFIKSNETHDEQSINEISKNLKKKSIFTKDQSKQATELKPMITSRNYLDKEYFTDLIRYTFSFTKDLIGFFGKFFLQKEFFFILYQHKNNREYAEFLSRRLNFQNLGKTFGKDTFYS